MKVKALIKQSAAPQDVEIKMIPLRALNEDECLIKVQAVGICGSDIHMYDGHKGYDWVQYPLILGHEVVGEVIEVGSSEHAHLKGTSIVVDPYISCGTCHYCQQGMTNRCDNDAFKAIKTPIESLQYGFRQSGGLATHMILKVENALPIPKNTSIPVAAISEALAVSYTAIEKIDARKDKKILVVGPGPIGLGVAALLIGENVRRVDMLGTKEDALRLKKAKQMGCTNTYENANDMTVESFGGYDAVIDCSGHPAVPNLVIQMLNRGGDLILVGINTQHFSLPMDQIVRGEIQIKGSYGITRHNLQHVLSLLNDEAYPFEQIIAMTVDFDDVIEGFEQANRKANGKVVITFEGEGN